MALMIDGKVIPDIVRKVRSEFPILDDVENMLKVYGNRTLDSLIEEFGENYTVEDLINKAKRDAT